MSVTRAQAESVLKALVKRYRLDESDRPLLRKRETGSGWEIIWESGPFEWAYRFASGGVNEDVASALTSEFGLSATEAHKRATEEPVKVSSKVFIEPINSYSVGVYPR